MTGTALTVTDLAAATIAIVLALYAVFGGADFGGGIWDALAFGPRRARQRAAIAHAMGPVWEANHVWLIFVLVLLFSCFPRAFSALSIALFVPLHLALVGVTLRGVAFVFRKQAPDQRAFGLFFGISSVVTPVLFGACVGAVSTGQLGRDATRAWLSPLSIAMGLAALTVCAYQSAVFLAHATDGDLREDFRARAILAAIVVFVGATATLPLLRVSAPEFWSGLTSGPARLVVAFGVVASLVAIGALVRRSFAIARVASAAQTVAYVFGWAIAQWPYALRPSLTLHAAASPTSTIKFILATLPIGAALLVPSLVYLFRVFDSDRGSD
ncbi:MAG: cytochrome d ubiquinol oxidase subunit II [Polyangiales bacterium]